MKKISKVINISNNFDKKLIDGNLALNLENNDYTAPKAKKLVFTKKESKIVMGCWQQNYTSNGGDGC